MRNISEYIMLKGVQWQVVGRCNYDNTPGDWAAYKALTYNEQYKGEEVLLLRSCGYPPLSNKNIISFKEYIDQVKSLKVSKGYLRATYKDIEQTKNRTQSISTYLARLVIRFGLDYMICASKDNFTKWD